MKKQKSLFLNIFKAPFSASILLFFRKLLKAGRWHQQLLPIPSPGCSASSGKGKFYLSPEKLDGIPNLWVPFPFLYPLDLVNVFFSDERCKVTRARQIRWAEDSSKNITEHTKIIFFKALWKMFLIKGNGQNLSPCQFYNCRNKSLQLFP